MFQLGILLIQLHVVSYQGVMLILSFVVLDGMFSHSEGWYGERRYMEHTSLMIHLMLIVHTM